MHRAPRYHDDRSGQAGHRYRRRRAALLLVPLVGLLAGLLSVVSPTSASAVPVPTIDTRPKTAVALGDSFASGEGGRWQGNSKIDSYTRGTTDKAVRLDSQGRTVYDPTKVYEAPSVANGCHRAYSAPIHHVEGALGITKTVNLACSGAKNRNLWPVASGGTPQHGDEAPQVTRLAEMAPAHNIELVAIGVGGNDMGFSNTIKNCFLAWAVKHYTWRDDTRCWNGAGLGNDGIRGETMGQLPSAFDQTIKTIKTVRNTLAAAGHPEGSYKIVLTGYPNITPDFYSWKYGEGDRREQQCPVVGDDARYIHDTLVPSLNATMQAVAEETGVGFVELSNAFDDHQLCEAGTRRSGEGGSSQYTSSIDMEWVRWADVDIPLTELFGKAVFAPYWLAGDLLAGTGDDVGNQGDIMESMHPNQYGQQAIGTCIKEYLLAASTTGSYKCRNGAGNASNDMDVTKLPSTWYMADHNDGPINDAGIVTRTLTSQIAPALPGDVISVDVDIDHPRKGHLKIWLTSPSGKVFVLRDYNPDDTGAWFDRRYLVPHAPMEKGDWTLRIDDNTAGYTGTLKSWRIDFF